MTLGPRLVIPGTLIASIILVVFLYSLTAGVTFPHPVQAAELRTATPFAPPAAEVSSQPSQGENAGVPALIAAQASQDQGMCEVSSQFPESILQWCGLITRYANEKSLPPDLVAALIWQESGGNPVAYSKSGAVGLMQVMPRDGIAADFMCKNGPCFSSRPDTTSLQDPEFNISWGTNYLSGLVGRYGNYRDALKSYGPMNVGYYYADKVLGIFERYGQ